MTDHQSNNPVQSCIVLYLVKSRDLMRERIMIITKPVVVNFDYNKLLKFAVYSTIEMFDSNPVYNPSSQHKDAIFKLLASYGIVNELAMDIYSHVTNAITSEVVDTINYLNAIINADHGIAGFSFEYDEVMARLTFKVSRYSNIG